MADEVIKDGGEETVTITKKELETMKQGQMLQADYTKKTQIIAEERKQLEPLRNLAEAIEGVPGDKLDEFSKEFEGITERYRKGEISKAEANKDIDSLTALKTEIESLKGNLAKEKQDIAMRQVFDNTTAVINESFNELGIKDEGTRDFLMDGVWMKLGRKDLGQMSKDDVKEFVKSSVKPIAEMAGIAAKIKDVRNDTTPVGDKGGKGGVQTRPDKVPLLNDREARKADNRMRLGF